MGKADIQLGQRAANPYEAAARDSRDIISAVHSKRTLAEPKSRENGEIMRKLPIILLISTITLLAFLSACQPENEQIETTDLTDFATRYAAAWSNQDPEELASFYAENGSLRVNDGEPSVGRDAVTETARGFMTAFPDMAVRLVELRKTDDHIEFHWHWTGTNTGPGGTGNAVDLRGYERWTLDADGKIVESLGHFDDAEYQSQLNAGSATIDPET